MSQITEEEQAFLYKKRLKQIITLMQFSKYSQDLDSLEIYQHYNSKCRDMVFEIVEDYIRPNSTIANIEHLKALYQLAKQGHSCIIMSEHYSNFDAIGLYFIIRKKFSYMLPLFDDLVFLAAAKLNIENKAVLAFSESMNRLIIYPAREKELNIHENKKIKQLEDINKRSFIKMQEIKKEGKIIFMFPSGTRYRKNNPDSKNALEQTAGFLKRFEYVCFIGIAGNVLEVHPSNEMSIDLLNIDTLTYHISKPMLCKNFLEEANSFPLSLKDTPPQNSLPYFRKQVAAKITATLTELHKKAESIREPLVKNEPPIPLGQILLEKPQSP